MAIPDDVSALIGINNSIAKLVGEFQHSALAQSVQRPADPNAILHNLTLGHWAVETVFGGLGRHSFGPGGFGPGGLGGGGHGEGNFGGAAPPHMRPWRSGEAARLAGLGAPDYDPTSADLHGWAGPVGSGLRAGAGQSFRMLGESFARDKMLHDSTRLLTAEKERTAALTDGTLRLKDWSKELGLVNEAGAASGGLFKRAAVGAMVAGQAASPDAFATLTGSFQLLAASLGTGLVPTMAKASGIIQKLSRQYMTLSAGQRQALSTAGLLTAVLAGAVALSPHILAFGQLVKGVAGVTGISSLAGGAMGVLRAHPVAAGAGAAAAAAGAFLMYRLHERRQAYANVAERLDTAGQDFSAPEYLKSDEYRRYKALGAGAKGAVARDLQAARERAAAANRAYQESLPRGSDWIFNSTGALRLLGYAPEDRAANKLHAANEDVARLQKAYEHFGQGKELTSGGRLKSQRDEAVLGFNQLLLDIQSRSQPGFYGAEDLGKMIQLNALQESPLQEEIRQIQYQQLEELQKIAANSDPQLGKKLSDAMPRLQ